RMQIAQKNADTVASELEVLRDQLKETENRVLTAQKNEKVAISQRDALQSELGEERERAHVAEIRANIAASQRDAMEVELKNKEEAQGEKAQLTPHDADLAELPNSAPDTQFQEVREDVQPAHQDAKVAQTQPPNPGHNEKPASLTQA